MTLIVKGVNIPNTGDFVRYGNINIDKVTCNGVTVWEKVKEKIVIPYGSHFNQSTPSIDETYLLHKNAPGGHADYGPYSCQVVSSSLKAVQVQNLTNYKYAYFEYMVKDAQVMGAQIRNHNYISIGFGYCDPDNHPEKPYALGGTIDFWRHGEQTQVNASGWAIDQAYSDGRIHSYEIQTLNDNGTHTQYVASGVARRLLYKTTVDISGLTGNHGIQVFMQGTASPVYQQGKVVIGFCKLMA